MAYHLFKAFLKHQEFRVIISWYRSQQCFVMILERPEDDPRQPFYCSLTDDPTLVPKNLDLFLDALARYDIELPSQTIEAIIADVNLSAEDNNCYEHCIIDDTYHRITVRSCASQLISEM